MTANAPHRTTSEYSTCGAESISRITIVKEFISNLGNSFDTKAFSVDHIVGEGNVAFASGKFTHQVKSTGKPYASDWSLMCVIQDGKILEYHFYEDSASFVLANAK